MATYDGQWILTYENPPPSSGDGVLIGNGKLGVLGTTPERIVWTTASDAAHRVFNPFSILPEVTVTKQELNMYNSILTEVGVVADGSISIETQTYAPQQYPFCIVQTVKVTALANDIPELQLVHRISTPDNISHASFGNNAFDVNNTTIHTLTASGKLHNIKTEDDVTVAMTCGYMFETGTPAQYKGFNQDIRKPGAYSKIALSNLTTHTPIRFHIVSSVLTSLDFQADTVNESKSIILNILGARNAMSTLRSGHTTQWQNLWSTDLVIEAKQGITQADLSKLTMLRRATRYSLYNLYCSTRASSLEEITPFGLFPASDPGIKYSGDIWLVPALLLLKPLLAKNILEYRYTNLVTARKLALGMGFQGAKYPYIQDTLGYSHLNYWSVMGPLAIFNNALISVNVWNYFRITNDREWLGAKGYAILRDVADFFTSAVTVDAATGRPSLANIISLNGTENTDNTMTNTLARMALQFAIEAAYELNLPVKEDWKDTFFELPIFQDFPILRIDAAHDTSQPPPSELHIPEPLLVLTPYFSSLLFGPSSSGGNTQQNTVAPNLAYYTSPTTNPFNKTLEAILLGITSLYDPPAADKFDAVLQDFITAFTAASAWGNFTASTTNSYIMNDININCMFLNMLLQGAMSLNIQGGVAETRFYYQEMRLSHHASANLPRFLKQLRLTGNKATLVTVNNLLYE